MKNFKSFIYHLILKLFGEKRTTNQNIYKEKKVLILGDYGVCISDKILINPFALKKTLITILTKNYNFLSIIINYLSRFLFNTYQEIHYQKVFYLVARHGRTLESPNYAHWLLENLPMIYYFLEEKKKSDISLLIRKNSPTWVYQSLIMLGVQEKDIIVTRQRIFCNLLIYGSIPYIHSYKLIPSYFLRNWVSMTHKKNCLMDNYKFSSILFLSRQSSIMRKINNFSDIKILLDKYNILIVDTEKVTIGDQISLFSKANCIISQSGAALANMIYMPKNSKVIEITSNKNFKGTGSSNNDKWCWKELAKEMKHKYIIYEPETFINFKSDIKINIKNFEIFLRELSIK